MTMKDSLYKLSYTAGALMLSESAVAVDAYAESGSWPEAKQLLVAENRLQLRMNSSATRVTREIINRLKNLTEPQLALFRQETRNNQINLVWLAICKQYRFISEFAVEVVREKLLKMDYLLARNDYETFFNNKAEWAPELDELKESTRHRARQILFKMLRDAEIINDSNMIMGAMLSPEFIEQVKADPHATLAIFPVPESFS